MIGRACFCLLVAAAHLQAQSQTREVSLAPVTTASKRVGLTGLVTDSAGVAIGGAEVRAYVAYDRPDRGTNRTHHYTTADAVGEFHIPLVAGDYYVTVTRDGYGGASFEVRVPAVGNESVTVRLDRIPPR